LAIVGLCVFPIAVLVAIAWFFGLL
jgi:hypothetical protein